MVDKQSLSSAHHDWTGVTIPEFTQQPVVMQVRGEWACFTRPEFNSERVSYPIMTPSAAVGLLSSVFWKPQFRWVIEAIDVLSPLKWITMRRNEVANPIGLQPKSNTMRRGYLDASQEIQQRMTLMLRDVHYRIFAHIWVHPRAEEQNPAKWRDQARRRIDRGQVFRTPFLGMREFHADVGPSDSSPAVDWTEDLGLMLHSIHVDSKGVETYDWFDARVIQGRMPVPCRGFQRDGDSS